MATTLRLTVNEDTLKTLQDRADYQRRDLEISAQGLLTSAAKAIPPAGRYLVVSGDTLEALEQLLGGGSILNEGDLLKKTARLAGVSFQHVRLPFTPNQLELLAEKAERNGLTVQQLVERTAPRMYEQFFDLVART